MDAHRLIPRETVIAYLDGELSAEETRAFERQVAVDPALAAEVDEMRSLDALLDLYEVPPGLGGRVGERVRARVGATGVLRRLRVPLAAAAVLLLSVVIAISTIGGGSEEPAPAHPSAKASSTEAPFAKADPGETPMGNETQMVIENLHRIQARQIEELGLDSSELAFLMAARDEGAMNR